jgi:hypothetical protein
MHRRAFGLRPVPSLSSRPFGSNPSRLRACGAARFACLQGIGARPIPAARCLAPLQIRRPGLRRIGLASAPPQWVRRGAYAGACCGRLCECVPSSTLTILALRVTKDGSRTTARHRYGVSTPRPKTSTAGCGRGVLVCRWAVDLARVRARTGEAFVRGCRAGPVSFLDGSAQGVLVSL